MDALEYLDVKNEAEAHAHEQARAAHPRRE